MTGGDEPVAAEVIAAVFADGWGRITATVIRLTGDWDLAEECAQDAFARALARWPADGVPDGPLAWLTTTARHRALDRVRRASVEAGKLRLLAEETMRMPGPPPDSGGIADDRLELMFTCAHPALATDAQVALTLRSLAGLSTAEIARAFLVSEHTMGQRLFRAKQKGPPRRDPVPRAAGPSPARTAAGCAACPVPAVQRGIRGQWRRRPGPASAARGGDPAGPGAHLADAR